MLLLPCSFRELGAVDKILGPLTEVLEGVLQADQQLMEKTKAKVFSAFITVLQMKELRGEHQLLTQGRTHALPVRLEISVLGFLPQDALFPIIPSAPSSMTPFLLVLDCLSSPCSRNGLPCVTAPLPSVLQ